MSEPIVLAAGPELRPHLRGLLELSFFRELVRHARSVGAKVAAAGARAEDQRDDGCHRERPGYRARGHAGRFGGQRRRKPLDEPAPHVVLAVAECPL